MFDTHVHTSFSTDSEMSIDQAIVAARQKNLGLILTEHMDTNHPTPGMFVFDVDEYFHKYNNYKSDKLLLGIELGMTTEFSQVNREIVNKYPFDYVIGSIHFLGNYDIYYPDVYEGRSKSDIFNEYLTAMQINIKHYDYIDSLGHIDYISRYAAYEDKELYYHCYKEIIDDILTSIIAKEIVLELNGRRLSDIKAITNLCDIYSRYRELGGKYVTIGSDAHNVEAIGGNFDAALSICDKVQLRPVYFKNRKMEYCDIM